MSRDLTKWRNKGKISLICRGITIKMITFAKNIVNFIPHRNEET